MNTGVSHSRNPGRVVDVLREEAILSCFLRSPARSVTFSGFTENPLVGKQLKS